MLGGLPTQGSYAVPGILTQGLWNPAAGGPPPPPPVIEPGQVVPLGGFDRLGILGRPFGVGTVPALTGTDSHYALAMGNFFIESAVHIEFDPAAADSGYFLEITSGPTFRLGYCMAGANAKKLRLDIGSTTVYSSAISKLEGKIQRVCVFGQRSGSIYFYVNGEPVGSADISAEELTDVSGTTINLDGRLAASYFTINAGALVRYFVLSGAFPPEEDRDVIALQRVLNQDLESPVLSTYTNPGDKRLEVDFMGTLYGATTVVNNGTGGDLTIGSSKEWQEVGTIVERVSQVIPLETFYRLSAGHTATSTTRDYGFAMAQPVVARFLFADTDDMDAGTGVVLTQNGGANYIKFYPTTTDVRVEVKANNGTAMDLPLRPDQQEGVDLLVVCDGSSVYIYLNGQHIATLNIASALNFTGDCYVDMDYTLKCCRVVAYNPATVPAGLLDAIRAAVTDPESAVTALGTALIDFPIRSDLVGASETDIANQGSGGGKLVLDAVRSISCQIMYLGTEDY